MMPARRSKNAQLSVPWGYPPNQVPTVTPETLKAIDRRSAVHEKFIRESAKTTRLGYVLSAALVGGASILPIVAPEGREVASWGASCGLVAFAAGAMGYTRVSASKKKLTLGKTSRTSK